MTDAPALYRALLAQSRGCLAGGSPLNAALLARAAEDWSQGGPVRGLMAPWSDRDYAAQLDAATPLRLIAALHELALSGADLIAKPVFPMELAVKCIMLVLRHRLAPPATK